MCYSPGRIFCDVAFSYAFPREIYLLTPNYISRIPVRLRKPSSVTSHTKCAHPSIQHTLD